MKIEPREGVDFVKYLYEVDKKHVVSSEMPASAACEIVAKTRGAKRRGGKIVAGKYEFYAEDFSTAGSAKGGAEAPDTGSE